MGAYVTRLFLTAFTAVLFLANGCRETVAPAPGTNSLEEPITPTLAVAHGPGFGFLSPLSRDQTFSGQTDESARPTVVVCERTIGVNVQGATACVSEVALFAMTSGTGSENIRYDENSETYIVNWKTDQCVWGPCTLDARKVFRIRVLLRGVELGFSDVQVVPSRQHAKLMSGEYLSLVNGRTLPIKFRIAVGAVATSTGDGAPVAVSSDGGAMQSADGAVGLLIPQGAIEQTTGITIAPITTPSVGLIEGSVYRFGPDGTQFAKPVTLSIAYDPSKLPAGSRERSLGLFHIAEDGTRTSVPFSRVDPVTNVVTGEVSHFSDYGAGPNTPIDYIDVADDNELNNIGIFQRIVSIDEVRPLPQKHTVWLGLFDAQQQHLFGRNVTIMNFNPEILSIDSVQISASAGSVPALMTASAAGHLAVHALGLARLRVSAEDVTHDVFISVGPVPFTRWLSVEPANSRPMGNFRVHLGQTLQLGVRTWEIGSDVPVPNPAITWESSNPAIATVSSSGLVTARAPGSVTIIALADGVLPDLTVLAAVPPTP